MPLDDLIGGLFSRAGVDLPQQDRVDPNLIIDRLNRKALAPVAQVPPVAAPAPELEQPAAPEPTPADAAPDEGDEPAGTPMFAGKGTPVSGGKPKFAGKGTPVPKTESPVPLPRERPADAPAPPAPAPTPLQPQDFPEHPVVAPAEDEDLTQPYRTLRPIRRVPQAPDTGPTVLGEVGKAGQQGLVAGVRQIGQTGEALSGGAPTPLPQSPYAAPLGMEDLQHPLASGAPKVAYRLAEGAPTMAGGIAGGVAGAAGGGAVAGPPGAAVGGLAGGAAGAAMVGAAQTLGPYYAAELQKNPDDPEGAYDRAMHAAELNGAFAAAGWAAFPIKFFQGPVKNLVVQAFGVQPTISVAHKAASNLSEGKPVEEGLNEAAVEGAVGTAIPMAGHHAVAGALKMGRGGEAPGEGAPTTETVDDFLGRERGTKTRADIDEFMAAQAARETAGLPRLPPPGDVSPDTPKPTFEGGGTRVADAEHGVLKQYGYTDEQIGAMSDAQRRKEYFDAVESGVKPDVSSFSPSQAGEKTDTTSFSASNEGGKVIEPAEQGDGSRENPIVLKTDADVSKLGERIERNPTEGQAEAENFRHEHVKVPALGIDVSIETAANGIRKGKGPDGTPWQVTLPVPYGRIKGTTGADGEPVDVFLGPKIEGNPSVYVLDQKDPATGKFDEHKVMAGFASPFDAIETYLQAHDSSGPSRIQGMTALTPDQFQEWLKTGDLTKAAGETFKPPVPEPEPKTVDIKVNKPAQPKGPLTLAQYLASRGGLKPDSDLHALGLNSKTRVVVPGMGFRSIVRGGGMAMDDAIDALREGGFLPPHDPNQPEAFDTHERIREALDEELNRGRPQHAIGQELTGEDAKSKREQESAEDQIEGYRQHLREELEAEGISVDAIHPEDLTRAAEIMAREDVDAGTAFERAVMANALEDEDLTPTEIDDIFGEGTAHELHSSAAPAGRGQAPHQGGELAEPAPAPDLSETVEQLPGGRQDGQPERVRSGEVGEGSEPSAHGNAPRFAGGRLVESDRAADSDAAGEAHEPVGQAAEALTEHTEAGEQTVLPGAEKVSDADLAQRGADKGLKPKKEQKPADVGLFGDESKQTDLLDMAKAADRANVKGEERADGLQGDVPAGDAGASTEAVPATEHERPVGEGRRGEVEAGGTDVSHADQGRPEGLDRLPDAAPREGSGGTGEGDTAGLPAEPGHDDGAGRSGSPAQRRAARVTGDNHLIEPGALDEGRSARVKAQDNVRAIELTRQINAEARPATHAEQDELARYVGWGGIKGAFPDADGNFAKGFEEIGAKLKELLSKDEYDTARRSIQYAHYTAEPVVRAMWDLAERLGFKGGQVFEPGMGVGNFAGMMPPDVAAATQYSGLEMDHVTADIAKLLYPKWGVKQGDFTRSPLPENTFDLAIGNPPFADVVIKSDPKYKALNLYLHDYFFAKSIDAVRPGGVLMFISSAGTMNKIDPGARQYLADRAELVGAIRLPGDAFKRNAGTEVTTDIVILRKLMPDEVFADRSWTETVQQELPGPDGKPTKGAVNRYFAEHPEMVLGEPGFFDKLYEGRYAVRSRPGQDLKAELAKAIDRLPERVMQDWQQAHAAPEIDFATAEKKEGTFYLKDGKLMQVRGGAGAPVERRGKGVEGGRTASDIERIHGLIPIRDALRQVYAADLAGDIKVGDEHRKALNREYDAFVKKFGPINKAELQRRRPSSIQEEVARAEAREEARYNGIIFDEGTFDPSDMVRQGATTTEIARARKAAREAAREAGRPWDEGAFDPEAMEDVIIDKRPNVDPFMDDQESYRLRAIERYDDATGKASKTKVFTENVVSQPKPPQINSVHDAVLHVLSNRGRLDIAQVAGLAGKSEAETIQGLGETIFRDPGTKGVWLTRDEYLSGNVRKKLVIARAAAERDPSLRRNVEHLEAVQPAPLGRSQIHATLGMPWIPTDVVRDFGTQGLGLDKLKVQYIPKLAQWIVSGDTDSVAAMASWGTDRRRAPALLQDALNRQTPKIYDKHDDGTSSLNVAATTAANEKMIAIKEKFADWVWSEPERAESVARLYNENYNNIVVRDYNGDYLTTPGVSTTWSWRPHQTRVVARIIQSGNTYMAHAVGAGKTSAMIGAGMELRRLGLARKPMYAVPNHMLAQFTKEFYEQYPTAKIMVADERQFHTDRRKQFVANVAAEDLDAVIITHSAFGMIPISDEFQDGIIKKEMEEYRELLQQIPKGGDNRITRSRIEKQMERLEQRLSGRANKRRDQVLTFEQLGVDHLFVDEAHLFRKLDFATNMGNVKGISPQGSGHAWDLYVKSLYLDQQKPGRSLVLASGTPVTNTMAELFTISRYLQRQELEERGLSRFDAWAGAFGEPVSELEQDAAGGYKPVTRFSRFVNVPELSAMVRQVMDVVTSKQLEQYVVRPKLKGGKRQMHLAEKSPALEAYQANLAARMKAIQERSGKPAPGDDIMLSVIGDGRKAAIDMRLVYPEMKADPGSKLNLLIDNVHKIWEATKQQRFYAPKDGAYGAEPVDVGPATQMIFVNLGLNGKFSVPNYIRSELARRGVPKAEMAYIYDFKTHAQKQKLFNDMNEGKVRVLIGSTQKMATGVNAQRRLYAIHNDDPLWYPSDDEQRNGRGLRQGNMNPEIEIHDYSTKGTYDSTMWGMMARKAKFIQGFFEGDASLRDMDDLGEASQYEQAKAITTNDPRLIKLTELKQSLERAWRKKQAFDAEMEAIRWRRADARSDVKRFAERVEETKQDIATRQDIRGDKFKATVGTKSYTKRVDFGETLLAKVDKLANPVNVDKHIEVGTFGGFKIIATAKNGWTAGHIHMDVALRLTGNFDRTVASETAAGVVRSMESVLTWLEDTRDNYAGAVAKAQKFLDESEAKLNDTFKGDAEIADLAQQVRELEGELRAETAAAEAASHAAKQAQGPTAATDEEEPKASITDMGERLTPAAGGAAVRIERAVRMAIAHTVGRDAAERAEILGSLGREQTSWGVDLPQNYDVMGLYYPTRDLIKIALAGNPDHLHAAFHEGWHAIEKVLTPQENEILGRDVESLREYLASEGLHKREFLKDVLPGEIIAEAAAHYTRVRSEQAYANEEGRGPHGLSPRLRRIFEKIANLIMRLRSALQGLGFRSAKDIFEGYASGEMRERRDRFQVAKAFADTAPKASVRPRSGNLPVPKFNLPPESLREAMNDPDLSTRERLSSALDALLLTPARALWDKQIDLARLQRAAELANASATPEHLDTYLASTLYPGRAGERLKDAARDLFAPLFDAMHETGLTRSEVNDFLYARHAGERNAAIRKIDPENDAGSGMTDEEATHILSQAKPRQADFDRVAVAADAIVRHNRELMVNEGLEHPKTIMRWEKAYDHYMPMKGAEASEGEFSNGPSTGKGYDVRRSESRRALGRFDKAGDILTNLLDQTQRTIIRAEKNRVTKTFMRFVQGNPNAELYTTGLAEVGRRISPETGMVENYWKVADADRDNVIGAKVGGETYYIKLHHEGLALALKDVGAERLNPLMRMVSAFTRQFSAFQTARNPEFVLTNLARDLQDAGLALSSEQKKGFRTAFYKNFFGGRALIAAVLGEVGHTESKWGRLYEEWRLQGGKISTFGYKDLESIRADIEREMKQRAEPMAKSIALGIPRTLNPFTGHLVKLFEAMSEITESTTRLAVYAAARDVGLSKAESARAARVTTVNFSAKGKYGPILGALKAFINPQIQGSVNVLRRLRTSKHMRRAALAVIAAGFLTTMWNLLMGDKDDEGKSRYETRPYWEREKNIVIYLPGQKDGLKIPLGYFLQPFWMAGENAAMAAMGKISVGAAISNWIGTTVTSYMPFGSSFSALDLHSWLESITPTIATPLLELGTNRNWLDRPIHPDASPFNKGQPNSSSAKMTTSPLAQEVAEWMNRQSGGNHFQKGAVDIHPDDLEYGLNFALGGFGQFMLHGYEAAVNKGQGLPTPVEKQPFVRRFVIPGDSQQHSAGQYYDAMHEAREHGQTLRDAIKAERSGQNVDDARATIRDLAPKVGAREGPRGGVSIDADKVFTDANKELQALRARENQIKLSEPNPEKRAAKVKAVHDQQRAVMAEARKTYRNISGAPQP